MTSPNEKSEIIAELRKITRLLTVIATNGKTENRKIQIYSELGMTHQEIGKIFGKTANAIQKTLKRLENEEVTADSNG